MREPVIPPDASIEEASIQQTLDLFLSLAQDNTPEGWAKIDAQLLDFCNQEVFLTWARNHLLDEESGWRDLAATILESSDTVLSEEDVRKLTQLMMTDESYPGFRAACALAKRVDQEMIQPTRGDIKEKLGKFLSDPDVAEIARKYLVVLNG